MKLCVTVLSRCAGPGGDAIAVRAEVGERVVDADGAGRRVRLEREDAHLEQRPQASRPVTLVGVGQSRRHTV